MGNVMFNPIPYAVLTVAIRFWLSVILAGQSEITGIPNDVLDYVTTFVIGTVPEFPLVANIILALVTNGALIVWIALLVDL